MIKSSKRTKNRKWDILGIGNPLFDIVINISNEMFLELKIRKGSMNLISREKSKDILEKFKNIKWELVPGGSTANTLSGANLLGDRVSFLGVVGNDKFGKMYQRKIKREGMGSHLTFCDDESTGHSIILVTPDGERTMVTHLGAALKFCKKNIKKEEIIKSRILHIEAYQLENPSAYEAVIEASEIAKVNGTIISMDLSDSGLIKRNRKMIRNIVKKYVNIVFANENEAMEFSGKKNPANALCEISKFCDIAVVKLGEKGSLIKKSGKLFEILPHKVGVVNTNGAGDMYAAGILHGLIHKKSLKKSGNIASYISALVVSSVGARLDKKYHKLIYKYKIYEKRAGLQN